MLTFLLLLFVPCANGWFIPMGGKRKNDRLVRATNAEADCGVYGRRHIIESIPGIEPRFRKGHPEPRLLHTSPMR